MGREREKSAQLYGGSKDETLLQRVSLSKELIENFAPRDVQSIARIKLGKKRILYKPGET